MGDDPDTLLSYCAKKGIVVQASDPQAIQARHTRAISDPCSWNLQAYSPLGNGKLIADADLATIGKAHGKSSAQVALKWIIDKGLPLATKANTSEYLKEDIDLFSWNLSASERATLSAKTSPVGTPSWACTA